MAGGRAGQGGNARPPGPDGIVVVDKPAGWTSHDVVARMRRLLGTRKVGHGGTLDPMATGVLVIAAGRATRLLTYYSARDKDYTATIRLGQSTVTDDAEGEVVASADASGVSDDGLAGAVAALTGDIQQRPSAVSAIKVDGKRSYARVRGGEQVELAARPVTVSRFDVLAVRRAGPVVDVDVAVTVSSGTYVRALARDLGEALGVGGHLTALRRTRVGGLALDRALTLEQVEAAADPGPVPLVTLTDAAVAVLPVVQVSDADARALGFGQRLPAASMSAVEECSPSLDAGQTAVGERTENDDAVAIYAGVAVAVIRRTGAYWVPAIVFEPSAAPAPGVAEAP